MCRYRTMLSILRDKQALQAEFLKSAIVGILVALIFFGWFQVPPNTTINTTTNTLSHPLPRFLLLVNGRSGSHDHSAIFEWCPEC